MRLAPGCDCDQIHFTKISINGKNRKQIVAHDFQRIHGKIFHHTGRGQQIAIHFERAPDFCFSQNYRALFISKCHILNHREKQNFNVHHRNNKKNSSRLMAYVWRMMYTVWCRAPVFNGILSTKDVPNESLSSSFVCRLSVNRKCIFWIVNIEFPSPALQINESKTVNWMNNNILAGNDWWLMTQQIYNKERRIDFGLCSNFVVLYTSRRAGQQHINADRGAAIRKHNFKSDLNLFDIYEIFFHDIQINPYTIYL